MVFIFICNTVFTFELFLDCFNSKKIILYVNIIFMYIENEILGIRL